MAKHFVMDYEGRAFISNELLVIQYPEGDYDVAKAQPADDAQKDGLYSALYDHHQCFTTFKDSDEIYLPDGTFFAFVDGVHVVRYDDANT